MSSYHNSDTLEHHPQGAVSSPTRAYFPPSKTTATPSSSSSALSVALSEKLAATLASKKAYINLPSIQKVIASHNSKKAEEANAPGYDETIANIPVLDLLPPPPVYDIVNCSTSQTLLLVSSLINTILAVNDRLACPKITLFHSRAIPNISIEAYLSRILQYAPFQNEVLLIILLYFDRIGGGCKPTQVLTNSIPKSLLRQTSLTPADIKQLMALKSDHRGEDEGQRRDEKVDLSRLNREDDVDEDDDMTDEEEPIADEIYTSSSESPVGSKLIINSFNIHRLLITSILVASKFSSDVFYPNVRYARVGGLPLSELNQLELEFLFLSQFELNTTESELQTYGNKLLMYHQRLNGIERAAIDAITPVKGEYVRLSDKKHIVHDSKPVPPRIQTSLQSSQQQQQHHPPSGMGSPRPFVSSGPYRDSKEIIDDDEIMSEKADDPIGSPTDWQSGQSTPVISEAPTSKYPIQQQQRSNKMNLDHMIWPTNEMDTKYPSSTYYGAMVKDEDAARIEEEFNKASPPPESGEPNPKRKLQRLSSGTLETVPAKRVNTPSKGMNAEKSNNSQPNNKNILRPLFRKIASFASNRSDTAAPAPEPESSPQTTGLRSHPYLVRYRVSPASSSTNLASPEEITTPTTPTSRAAPWQEDGYTNTSQEHMRAPPSFQQTKPPPPPYSGQGQDQDQERQSRPYKASSSSRGRRQHRSREPSLSSLASELTFEPTHSSLSPMREEQNAEDGASHSATLAPFYFPPKPQVIQSARDVQQPQQQHLPSLSDSHQRYSTPPATPMSRKERSANDSQDLKEYPFNFQPPRHSMAASPLSEADECAMQCDDEKSSVSSPGPSSSMRHFHSEPLAVSGSTASASSEQDKYKMRASERIEAEGLDADASSLPSSAAAVTSPSPLSISPSTNVTSSSSARGSSQRVSAFTSSESEATAGRHWIPKHAPAPTHPPYPHPHPHYVASYYPAPPNMQLLQDPSAAVETVGPRPSMVAIPRNPQALPVMGSSTTASKVPLTSVAPRPTRQFAPIRPRTPMMVDEGSNGRAVQPTTEPASSSTTQKKKKKGSISSEFKSHYQQTSQSLRPLVPTVLAAPPPYRPPFIAYPASYAQHPHHPHAHLRGPDGAPSRPPAPMLMAVDYSQAALVAAAAAGHAPQFITAAAGGGLPGAAGPGIVAGGPGAATTRLYIPVIPVMYNKPSPQLAPGTPMLMPMPAGSNKPSGKTNTPARIAPRLHRA
ncbi:hypothetical protein EDD11_006382 [Mortierella claussenii]|nr:hypothetical protein EDD11_006382 [Mortierella claussenii]